MNKNVLVDKGDLVAMLNSLRDQRDAAIARAEKAERERDGLLRVNQYLAKGGFKIVDSLALQEARANALEEAAEACKWDDAHECRTAILALKETQP